MFCDFFLFSGAQKETVTIIANSHAIFQIHLFYWSLLPLGASATGIIQGIQVAITGQVILASPCHGAWKYGLIVLSRIEQRCEYQNMPARLRRRE